MEDVFGDDDLTEDDLNFLEVGTIPEIDDLIIYDSDKILYKYGKEDYKKGIAYPDDRLSDQERAMWYRGWMYAQWEENNSLRHRSERVVERRYSVVHSHYRG